MDNFIEPKLYSEIFINLCLFIVLFTLLHTFVLKIDSSKNLAFINISGLVLLFFLIFFMGPRPINIAFGDTVNYNVAFQNYARGSKITETEDYGWHVFMKLMSNIISINTFLTICIVIYIYPLYKISKTCFNEYWYYSFLMFVVSFSFWTYGVNGVRNGAACSLFLWGVCYHKNKVIMSLLFFLAIIFHKTLALPIIAFMLTYFYNDPKFYLKGWLICIPLSLIMGSLWISVFASLGFGDDRLAGYLTGQSEDGTFSKTGFRWDFLFHSAFAVFSGWYFVIKKKFKDQLYFKLLNTYLICNGFWILVITANYSNRFAYLSWFMMGIVIIYPLLKERFFKKQHLLIGKVIFIYFMFTFSMFYLYTK